jgi:hypothetical protein
MAYHMLRGLGDEPVFCLPGLKVQYDFSGGQQCVKDPDAVPAAGMNACFNRPHEYDATATGCKCEFGYIRDIDTLECVLENEPTVVNPVPVLSPGPTYVVPTPASTTPTWAIVLGATGVGLLLLGAALR